MEFRQVQLDNGLSIVCEVNPSAASMAMGFFVATGSRDETPEVSGVSHFLEHMVFKGTARRSAADVNRELDEMGADANAATSEENTIFYASVLPEFQGRCTDLLADILRPSLRQEDFDVEKKVILDEIGVYDDRPPFRVYEKLMQTHFRGHPLGASILGTRESIGALRREQMLDYFGRQYRAGNITAIATGKVDFDLFVADVKGLCGGWPAGRPRRRRPPSPRHVGREALVDPKVVRLNIGLMSPAPAADSALRHAAHLVSSIVGDSTGSRLYYALVEKGLVDEASMQYSAMDGAGSLMTFLSCDPDKGPAVHEIARREMERFAADGPTEEELLAAKNKTATGATMKSELPIGRLSDVGFDWIYRGQYEPLADLIVDLFAVSRRQVHDLARELDLAAYTLVSLGPTGSV